MARPSPVRSERSALLGHVARFAVPFLVTAVAAFSVRTWQNSSTARSVTSETTVPVAPDTIADTTAPQSPLTVDSVATPTEVTVVASTEPPTTEAATTAAPTDPPRTVPPLPAAPTDGDGALLRAPSGSDRRLYDANAGCTSLVRPGSASRSCELLQSDGIDVAVVSMESGVDVLTHVEADGPDVWSVALTTSATPSHAPLVTDVTGDDQADVVVGFRAGDRTLAVDVVQFADGGASVTLHLSMVDGRVSAGDGQLDAWSGLGNDPALPSSYVHWVYTGGPAWDVSADRTDSAPGGQL